MNASTGFISDEARRLANRQANEEEERRMAALEDHATTEGMPEAQSDVVEGGSPSFAAEAVHN